jgi:uncharacterized Zn finger protein
MTPDLIVVMTCVSCGGDLEWIAQGKPGAQGSNIAAVGECTECGRSWVARVMLLSDGKEGKGSATKRLEVRCSVCGEMFPAHYGEDGRRTRKRTTCSAACLQRRKSEVAYARLRNPQGFAKAAG